MDYHWTIIIILIVSISSIVIASVILKYLTPRHTKLLRRKNKLRIEIARMQTLRDTCASFNRRMSYAVRLAVLREKLTIVEEEMKSER